MRGRMFVLASAVAMVPLASTCGDSVTGPVGGEVIALVSVNDAPLPVTLEEAPGYLRTFLADTIHLGSNGRWSRRQLQEFTTPTEEPRLLDWTSDGTIDRVGDRLVLDFVCNDTASCIAPDRLVPGDGGYRIEREVSVDSVLVFRYEGVSGGGS